jgi:hypothetical protein
VHGGCSGRALPAADPLGRIAVLAARVRRARLIKSGRRLIVLR